MAMTTATPRIASSHNSHGGAPVASPEALEGGGVLAVGSGVVIAEPAGERVGLAVVSVRPARPVRERDCVTDGLSVESAPPFAVRVGWAVSERDSAADGLSVLPESPPPHEAISTAVSDRTAIRKWTGRMAQPSPDSHVNLGPPSDHGLGATPHRGRRATDGRHRLQRRPNGRVEIRAAARLSGRRQPGQRLTRDQGVERAAGWSSPRRLRQPPEGHASRSADSRSLFSRRCWSTTSSDPASPSVRPRTGPAC
jgi:hypothetical protein